MGAAFASAVLGVERPRVGLLSNGEEAERGSELVVQAGDELARRLSDGQLRFVGNVEGGDIVAEWPTWSSPMGSPATSR